MCTLGHGKKRQGREREGGKGERDEIPKKNKKTKKHYHLFFFLLNFNFSFLFFGCFQKKERRDMSKRYVGQSTTVPSNNAGYGGIEGSQIGELMPGVLESLQEAPSALSSTNLYYEEALGSYLAPSFQKQYGVKNERVDNVDGWGQSGTFSIPNDIFWNGPAAIEITVPLHQRWAGHTTNLRTATNTFLRPSFFYSHGAGYAAIKEFRMNMGGAGLYTLDRYANFIGVFSSCVSLAQRYALMKISGGGVIGEDNTDLSFGVCFETTKKQLYTNRWFEGYAVGTERVGTNYAALSTLLPRRLRLPSEDKWVVSIKTPHTNYQNPKTRRRPLDTKLFSEHFTVDFKLSNFDEICDSGTGVPLIVSQNRNNANGIIAVPPSYTPAFQIVSVDQFSPFPENFRQYENIYGTQYFAPVAEAIKLARFRADSYPYYTALSDVGGGDYTLTPLDSDELLNNIGPLLSPHNLPKIHIETVISSMRLTNDLLGAYDVLKTRTDQAVYYPFQYFTTQILSVQNTLYGDKTLNDYVNMTQTMPNNDTTAPSIRLSIPIPVNPMTAMYVGIAREKDRRGLGISKKGGYSPVLFWNFLPCTELQLSYGSEPLIKYSSVSQYVSQQVYEHCQPIQIPYKGGFCLKSELENTSLRNQSTKPINASLVAGNVYGKYNGVLRNSWIYELSLVEMEPLRNEAFFQQTPSFQGEQLDLSFKIEPSTVAFNECYGYTDVSYVDDYYGELATEGVGPETFRKGLMESKLLSSASCDLTGIQQDPAQIDPANTQKGYTLEQKGGPVSQRKVDVWHMNNDANLMVVVVYAQNALWQLNPNMSKIVFSRG